MTTEGQKDLMCILTSVRPQKNSAQHVSFSTRRAIKEEIERGERLCQDIEGLIPSEELLSPLPFFESFPAFLVLYVSAVDEPLHFAL